MMNPCAFYKAKRIIKNSTSHGKAAQGGFYASIDGASVVISYNSKHYHNDFLCTTFTHRFYTVTVNGNRSKTYKGNGIFGGMSRLYRMAAAKSVEVDSPEEQKRKEKEILDAQAMADNFRKAAIHLGIIYNCL